MYPPKVRDADVRETIRELIVDGHFPSGAALRAALAQRFDSRGGVARIYRLLAAERMRHASTGPTSVNMRLLEQELSNLRQQLQQSRQRDDAHQAHWSREIAQLRQRVEALEPLVRQAADAGAVSESLRQEVQGAEVRAGQLDVQLRVFGPGSGRSTEREP